VNDSVGYDRESCSINITKVKRLLLSIYTVTALIRVKICNFDKQFLLDSY
jgi:hypothetical protein